MIEKIIKRISEKKEQLEKYDDLTQEEQDILDSIKIGLEDIKEGRGNTIEEVRNLVLGD